MADEQPTSAWSPLGYPLFRALWIASLVSNIGTWMQNVGGVWLMTSLSPSPFLVALMQTATSLPVFLVGLPAGALADIVDRRRLLLVTQGLMLVAAAVLSAVTMADLVDAKGLLALTFILGLGTALNTPTWQAVMPTLVPRRDLPAAVALNGVTINVGRAVGPALGGVVVAAAGPGAVFLLNALSFVGVLIVVYRWHAKPTQSVLPAERVLGATRAGLRYVRYAPEVRAVLVRAGVFIGAGSALWALLPVLARRELGLGAAGFGVLLGCIGLGAVGGATVLPRLRGKYSVDHVLIGATVVFALVTVALALLRDVVALSAVMVAGGVAWIMLMASFNTAAQNTAPAWVRARALGAYLLVFQGGLALGGVLWGAIAARAGTRPALIIAAVALVGGLPATMRWPMTAGTTLDLRPSLHWPEPRIEIEPRADEGPVQVTVEYRINPEQRRDFVEAMHALGRMRRRDGAIQWGVFRDAADSGRYVETFLVESWVEHLRQHQRGTVADRAIVDRARAFHRGATPPEASHLIYARPKEETS
jgi:MFS family permease/quinol monooxygenase YgiN